MNTARATICFSARIGMLACLALGGCSSSGGMITLFPTGDHLLKSTDLVRREVPRRVPIPRELDKTVLSEYILQPGDMLIVEPTALDAPVRFPADQTILPDGTIDLARYGRLIVAGKTIEQVEADVMAAIRMVETGPVDPVNVRLVNPQSAVYYVLGEVNSPGSFPLIGRETVLDALIAAGGLGDRASMCNIILSRPSRPDGCRTVLPVCYRQIVQLGDTTTNYQVMPGDRIYVATRSLRDSCFGKRNCPLCSGQQCPCPSPTSALAPALPTITPPHVIDEGVQPLPELEPIATPAAPPEEMPPAPSARRANAAS
ncbi:MAG TPA: SLBB domain-containing protein [Pirellulales bacterium]|nr:SLBB domain-containing protein [Pirellulales bacterium]